MSKSTVHSIHFYQSLLPGRVGSPKQAFGAVVFGEHFKGYRSCILRIIPPMSDLELLYQNIGVLHSNFALKLNLQKPKPVLYLKKYYQEQIIDLLENYCAYGVPLPNLFTDGLAVMEGLTEFQKKCYELASLIPHGQTRPYAWLAEKLGAPMSVRAVGNAMRNNPFPLFIPCHRVLKKNGDIGGYMGATTSEAWQVCLKKIFLELESSHQQPSLFPMDYFNKTQSAFCLN